MANTYFRYTKSVSKGVKAKKSIELAAIGGNDNLISLTLMTELGNKEMNLAFTELTEAEQDHLIAGILERRGVHAANTLDWLKLAPKTLCGISADGEEQSIIQPAKR